MFHSDRTLATLGSGGTIPGSSGRDGVCVGASCFDGCYVTGDVTAVYLHVVETRRDAKRDTEEEEGAQLDLNLAAAG